MDGANAKPNQSTTDVPCEHVKFEIGNVVVARQIDGGFQRHRLQTGRDCVHFGQLLPEDFPRHQRAVDETNVDMERYR